MTSNCTDSRRPKRGGEGVVASGVQVGKPEQNTLLSSRYHIPTEAMTYLKHLCLAKWPEGFRLWKPHKRNS